MVRGMKIQIELAGGSRGGQEKGRPGAGAPGLIEIVSQIDE